MEEKSSETLLKIQRAAIDEFLEKGFLKASLRQIVKYAGVTTGAFYGYFSSKEALFASIVEPHAALLKSKYIDAHIDFANLPEEKQPEHLGVESKDYIDWMVDYICCNRKPVKLLLCKSEGTSYENFLHSLIEIEVESTIRYLKTLQHLGYDAPDLNPSLCHILASGMIGGIFEIVIHDIPKSQAIKDVEHLRSFYTAGWLKLLNS
ncbi:TetR/AcrR family transcriptional regulator [Thomasclavelia sp.]|uniref:TetR/AcrR family transcriptional regulator n=1 Tax=Thomasclavelia sp. TaxID=3025757 RepID=UPI0025FBB2D2|nr:TetR/AcrR family transcriptional regulator [Thomasclavelia sp.]